ncbi:MAG: aromatic amino acid lyase, partial [Chloroflexi bacterium]|nr:aromatic amino acid lyase [Chloroflexota bacterium]
HARQVLEQVEGVVAIELLVAAQALSLRADQGPPGRGTAAAMDQIRKRVAVLEHDRSLAADVERLRLAVRSGEILSAARAASAPGQAGLS